MIRSFFARQLRTTPLFQPSVRGSRLTSLSRLPTSPHQPCVSLHFRRQTRLFHPTPFTSQYRRSPNYNRFSGASQVRYLWYNSPGFRYGIGFFGLGCGLFYVKNLEEVPVTHRLRFNCVPSGTLDKIAGRMRDELLDAHQGRLLPDYDSRVRLVKKVLNKLVLANGLNNSDWEVFVVDDKNLKNAFVVPGGKVFVFTGILPICKDEDGLAAVLGHEIAHNIAHHSEERLSKAFVVVPLALMLTFFLDISSQMSNLLLQVSLELPNSRKMESEADHIGLLMMAQSCYDPKSVIPFWQRMQQTEKSTRAPPALLSTHPTNSKRIEVLTKLLPEAELKWQDSACGVTGSHFDDFRKTFSGSQWPASAPKQGVLNEDDTFW